MRFFDDDGMDFAVRCVLSGVRDGMAEVGEVFAVCETIRDGDPGSWLDAYVALGRRLRAQAEEAERAGHRHSAWNAALRSANYLFAGLWWAPATRSADRADDLWSEHRDAWDLAVRHWPTPAGPTTIPHGHEHLPGYWFTSTTSSSPAPLPTVVLVQGLNTPISDACMTGMSGALALLRGTTTEPTGADTLDDALALLDDCAIDADRLDDRLRSDPADPHRPARSRSPHLPETA